jgi:hypothetical protein
MDDVIGNTWCTSAMPNGPGPETRTRQLTATVSYYRPIKAPDAINKQQRPYHRGEPCSMVQYWLIINLFIAGWSQADISRHPQVAVHRETVSRKLQSYAKTASLQPDTKGSKLDFHGNNRIGRMERIWIRLYLIR